MADVQAPVPLTPNTQRLDEDLVFSILGDPLRRKLLMALARKGSQPASKLHPIKYEHQLFNIVKHLGVMRNAGVVTRAANPVDGRQGLYSLSPAVLAASESNVVIDFGFCIWRLGLTTSQQWNEDLVFSVLADPVRRRLLLSLARGGPQPALHLQGASQRNHDVTLKRLVSMRTSGLVTMSDNPKDGRRNLYSLSPKVSITTDGKVRVIDFGFCVLRLG